MTHKDQQNIIVLIVAAGSASRFGASIPKQYAEIEGATVLHHTISAFLNCAAITHIQVVIQDGHQSFYQQSMIGLKNILPPVIGGSTRQGSVKNGLNALENFAKPHDIILIHDAARPCISQTEIESIIAAMQHEKAACLVVPVTETLRLADDNILGATIPRDHVMALQTPQAFRYGDIHAAHIEFADKNFTDDTALASAAGIAVTAVQGHRSNIKITHAEDMMFAQKLMAQATQYPRTAMGFDVHAFGDASATIRLGGIDIPHTHKLSGHSDADVVLHALTDALYGLIADGDIGSHFPPSNAAYKGMNSQVFLEDAVKAVRAKGTISHLDMTIICEAPKIGPHRDIMRTRIAEICGLKLSQVSIKATTTEQLGFTGRREGIAVQAVATGMFYDD